MTQLDDDVASQFVELHKQSYMLETHKRGIQIPSVTPVPNSYSSPTLILSTVDVVSLYWHDRAPLACMCSEMALKRRHEDGGN
jgi:hypothetical protein